MGRKLKNLCLEDHLKLAEEIFYVEQKIRKIKKEIAEKDGVSEQLYEDASVLIGKLYKLKNNLDNDYCKIVDDQNFEKLRFIYYKGREFWENYNKEKNEKGEL